MVTCEKLRIGKTKTIGKAIKEANTNGVVLEYKWVPCVQGVSKAKDIDEDIVFTGNPVERIHCSCLGIDVAF
jgi:hypothetical protein